MKKNSKNTIQILDLKFKPIVAYNQKKIPTKRKAKKDLTYWEAKKRYPKQMRNPHGDFDRDNVPNWSDCRPFDSTKDFFGLSDITAGATKLIGGFRKQKPIAETRTPLSRAPGISEYQVPYQRSRVDAETRDPLSRAPKISKSAYKTPKQVYLYVKSEGKWTKIKRGTHDEIEFLLKKMYASGDIEDHTISPQANLERRLNIGEKVVKPVVREAKRAKKHFIETAPKALGAYQQRIGLGETRGELFSKLGERMYEGVIETKPYPLTQKEIIKKAKESGGRKVKITEMPDTGEEFPGDVEEIETTYQFPEGKKQKSFVSAPARQQSFVPPSFDDREQQQMIDEGFQISPDGMEEIQAPRKGMPPYSKGWAGSIGGSRPYRPVPYKPTGKIWKPERRHNPMPKIPIFKPPEKYYDLMPKIPIIKPFFVGKKRDEEVLR